MLIIKIIQFSKKVREYLGEVFQNYYSPTIKYGKNADVVTMSMDKYNSLMATQHELKSLANKKRLDSAIRKLS